MYHMIIIYIIVIYILLYDYHTCMYIMVSERIYGCSQSDMLQFIPKIGSSTILNFKRGEIRG